MRIDAHQHFWIYEPSRHSWISDQMSVLKRDFLPGDLLPELAANGFDGSIAVQADQSEEETRFLLDLAEHQPALFGVVGWIDLTAPDIEERLASFLRFEKLCGFRHIVQSEPDDQFMLRADFRRGIRALSGFDFSYDILVYPRHLPAAIELAASLPDQRFVLDHLAKPGIKTRMFEPWAKHIRELASCPNVFCKLSGMVTEADWTVWKPDDFRTYLDVAFECFGTDRLMFGSDWPVCLLAGTYGQVRQIVAEFVGNRSASEQEKIFGANAARFYSLKN